jgi:hypothetical protein
VRSVNQTWDSPFLTTKASPVLVPLVDSLDRVIVVTGSAVLGLLVDWGAGEIAINQFVDELQHRCPISTLAAPAETAQ